MEESEKFHEAQIAQGKASQTLLNRGAFAALCFRVSVSAAIPGALRT